MTNNRPIKIITAVLTAVLFIQLCVYFGLCRSEKNLQDKLNYATGDLVAINYEIDKVKSEISEIENR